MKNIFIIVILLICFNIFSDTNFKVMSYNALNFSGSSSDRAAYFKDIIELADPDVIVMQEILDQTGADLLLSTFNQINNEYTASNFVNGFDTDNMLFYKNSVATLLSQNTISTNLRDISEYVISIDGNQFRIYSCHLKSSTGTDNEQQRLQEVLELRTHLESLTTGTEYCIVGDMNFYTSSEPAYQNLTITTPPIAEDLCLQVGNWHDGSSYSSVHTQSTRLTAFGYGASGGLDDKFDFIFSSPSLSNNSNIEYVSNSFESFGNDGNHFNQSINDGTNSSVPADIADALYYASDHLPVCADFTSISGIQTYLLISEYIEGSSYNKVIEIYNGTGAEVDLSAYSLEKDSNGNSVWGNSFSYSGMLATGDVYVLANSAADPIILGIADDTDNGVINFNGDDQVRLLKYGVEIDRIGIPGDVDFAKDVTYVRNSTITDPQSGAQDPRSNGEWDEYPMNTFSYLGSHSAINPTITITSPNGNEMWERGNPYDIIWTSSDFTNNVKIELFQDTIRDYIELVNSTDNDGSWEWNISSEQVIASNYKIRISDVNDGNPNDESDDFFSITGTQAVSELFISEYIEGSGNNKALEIFNGTGSIVDLSEYMIERCNNGIIWGAGVQFFFDPGVWIIADGDVWVNANADAVSGMQAVADLIGGQLTYFNGDDSIGLFKTDGVGGWTLIDVIGENGVDPGSAWPVAGVAGATGEHTLVRKSSVTTGNTDWVSSAGTDVNDSEWIVYPQDTFDDLGNHEYGGAANIPPAISNILNNPANPNVNETVAVTADITDFDGIISASILSWGTDGTSFPNSVNMILNTRASYITQNQIPAQTEGTTVYYYLEATDDDNATTTSVTNSYTIPIGSNEHTIYEIQGQTSISPFNEQIVTTSGIVTATYASGYFLQDGEGAWNGILVYDSSNLPVIGDDVTVEGEVYEYYDLTEIRTITSFTINSSGNELPNVTVLTTLAVGIEDYESVLIEIQNAECTELLTYNEWYANDGSGNVRINDLLYDANPEIGTFYNIVGILNYNYSNFKIEPRNENDVTEVIQQLAVPQNVNIEITNDQVSISWDSVSGAASYEIYSSENPDDIFIEDTSGTLNGTTWTAPSSSAKRFYFVKAIN